MLLGLLMMSHIRKIKAVVEKIAMSEKIPSTRTPARRSPTVSFPPMNDLVVPQKIRIANMEQVRG